MVLIYILPQYKLNLLKTPNILTYFISGASAPTNSDQLCAPEDMDCHNYNDHLGLEAIRSLHEQLDDDDNGDIDLSESDDVKIISRFLDQLLMV